MLWALGRRSIDDRITDSQPTRWVNALIKMVLRIADRINGTHQRGRRAISAKALPGEKKTPARRPASLILSGSFCDGSNGGGVGAGSGVIRASLIPTSLKRNGFQHHLIL